MEFCKKITHSIEENFEQDFEKTTTKVEKFCEDLPWPIDLVCKFVTVVIKVIEKIVVTIVKVWVTVVCYTVMTAVTLVAEVFNLLLAIPIVGPILKWGIGAIVWFGSQLIGLIDAIAGLLGVRPIKHLRLHIIILMRDDHTLTVPADRVGLTVQRTESILRARADVKVHTTVHQVNTPSLGNALYVDTDAGLLAEDMTGAGLYFQTTITEMLWEQNLLFAIRLGAPVVAFIVDGVGTTPKGCSAGPLCDYICIEGGQMLVKPLPKGGPPVLAPITDEPLGSTINDASTTLAHELGHACGLLHDNPADTPGGDVTNLMFWANDPESGPHRGDNLSPFQRAIIRSSPHVTYL